MPKSIEQKKPTKIEQPKHGWIEERNGKFRLRVYRPAQKRYESFTVSDPTTARDLARTKYADFLKEREDARQHGYGIAAQIQQISDDALRVEEGSLYPALHRMEQAGWIAAEWQVTANNRRARLYRITRAGQKRFDEELEKWNRLTKAVGKVLRFA